MEQSKKNISVRLTASDIKKIKDIAERIGVKYSDLFRFSVKSMLTRLMPLHDKELRGTDLIPTLLECGEELMDYFDIDSEQLDWIVNHGVADQDKRVDTDDLDLMVLSYLNQNYGVKKLSEMSNSNVEAVNVNEVLKNYLYEKYVIDSGHGHDRENAAPQHSGNSPQGSPQQQANPTQANPKQTNPKQTNPTQVEQDFVAVKTLAMGATQ